MSSSCRDTFLTEELARVLIFYFERGRRRRSASLSVSCVEVVAHLVRPLQFAAPQQVKILSLCNFLLFSTPIWWLDGWGLCCCLMVAWNYWDWHHLNVCWPVCWECRLLILCWFVLLKFVCFMFSCYSPSLSSRGNHCRWLADLARRMLTLNFISQALWW